MPGAFSGAPSGPHTSALPGAPDASGVHRCPHCAYVTRNGTHLKRHLLRHTGDRPYGCPVCPFRANQREIVKRHMQSHTGEKPFACAFCTASFADKRSLKRHHGSHHPNLPPLT